ncbi:class I SAM-dependent DNA methyltransferase [Mumia sp. Pv 4-285]|uniref:class I SAM-dependent DNA methyltransferase n=1 Tax=Mumia qirimensis TaxID=3234852 RepID=UPI00351D8CF2
MSYRLSHSSHGKAAQYDRSLSSGYHHDLWTEVERPLIERVLHGLRDSGATRCLDFACGTGRVTAVCEPVFATTVGVDVSDEMLSRARERCQRATLVRADLTQGRPDQVPPRVDVATAFRFFVNAEPSLRRDALQALRTLLSPDGHLVMNVQWNTTSLAGAAYRLRGLLSGNVPPTLSPAATRRLLESNGFVVVAHHDYGALPWMGSRWNISTPQRMRTAERWLAGRRLARGHLQQFLVVARAT